MEPRDVEGEEPIRSLRAVKKCGEMQSGAGGPGMFQGFQDPGHVAGQAARASIPHSRPGAPTLNASRLVTVADSCI